MAEAKASPAIRAAWITSISTIATAILAWALTLIPSSSHSAASSQTLPEDAGGITAQPSDDETSDEQQGRQSRTPRDTGTIQPSIILTTQDEFGFALPLGPEYKPLQAGQPVAITSRSEARGKLWLLAIEPDGTVLFSELPGQASRAEGELTGSFEYTAVDAGMLSLAVLWTPNPTVQAETIRQRLARSIPPVPTLSFELWLSWDGQTIEPADGLKSRGGELRAALPATHLAWCEAAAEAVVAIDKEARFSGWTFRVAGGD